MNERSRLLVVTAFALAMAWVESAVVLYLRTIIDRIEPYQPNPLPIVGGLVGAELVREAATLVMLAAAVWLWQVQFWVCDHAAAMVLWMSRAVPDHAGRRPRGILP